MSRLTLRVPEPDLIYKRPNWQECRRALAFFVDPESWVMVQNLPNAKFRCFPGSDLDDQLAELNRLSESNGYGLYFTINPAREPEASAAINEGHIIRRRWLLIDIDRSNSLKKANKETATCSTTDAEKEQIWLVAVAIHNLLTLAGWPEPAIVDSGNGYHLYYRIDCPADAIHKELIRDLLKALGRACDTDTAEIDKTCHDARRISKLPGSWARKGPDTEDRPHRMAQFIDPLPEVMEVVDLEKIKRFVADHPEHKKKRSKLTIQVPDTDNRIARAVAYIRATPEAISGAGGHSQTFALARAVIWGFDLDQETGYQLLAQYYNPCCKPEWSERELRHKCKDADTKPYDKPRGWLYQSGQSSFSAEVASPATTTEKSSTPKTIDVLTYSLPDLLSMEIPPARWAVEGLLSEGLSILGGKPKLGKSWMALNLAITIAAGGKALGNIQTQPGDVLYLALEDRLRRLQSRCKRVMGGLAVEASSRLNFAIEWPKQDQGGLQLIEKWLESVPLPKLVIVDVWARFKSPSKGRGPQYEEDYEIAGQFKQLADRFGVSFLAVHHCKKQATDDQLEEISGTNGFAGAADGVMVLTRSRGENEGEVFLTGRDFEEQKIAVAFNPETCCWTNLGPAEIRVAGQMDESVLCYLKSNPTVKYTCPEIVRVLGAKYDSVNNSLKKLSERGIIQRQGKLWYWPTDMDDAVRF